MTDFQPIPGVWYRINDPKAFPNDSDVAYLPRSEQDESPWIDADGGRWAFDNARIISIEYNPHPPTRTEYRYYEPRDDSYWPTTAEDVPNYMNAKYLVFKSTRTEWNEIDLEESPDAEAT